jgi:trimethylamine--corrinoid protein Co-methyltransferase
MSGRTGRRNGGGRTAKLLARQAQQWNHRAFFDRRIPYFELLGEEALELIEEKADTVLEEIGIEFRDFPEALQRFREAGADVTGERVRFPRGMCRALIQASAPREFTQYARNPEHNVLIGGKHMVLAPAYGSPFVHDIDRGRRYATLDDFRNFVKLTYLSPVLHHSGGTVCEPVDIPVDERHLDMVYSHIRYSDKAFMGSVTHPDRARDSIEMAKLVFGDDFVENNAVLTSLINANSPMVFDGTMLGAATVYAQHNQATLISPFILTGAMSPVTVAGTTIQVLAEALAGMAYVQLVRPGAPVIFGTFAATVSMLTGAPTFGTPEASMVMYACATLARRLGVPFRSGGALTSSKVPDAQAACESAVTLQAAALAGVNFGLHSAGWLEGGLAMGYEKFVMDIDQINMLGMLLKGVDLSENGLAMDALREVGPGAHFLGATHTRANFESAFCRSIASDSNSYEQWQQEGSQDMAQRANTIWKMMLNGYEQPPLDPAIDEALLDFMARRKAEVGGKAA